MEKLNSQGRGMISDALTDPILDDEDHHGEGSEQFTSSRKQEAARTSEDDIESQRATSGAIASTSAQESYKPVLSSTKEVPEEEEGQGGLEADIEAQSNAELKSRPSPEGKPDIEAGPSTTAAPDYTSPPSSSADPEVPMEPPDAARHPSGARDSWDYKADDFLPLPSSSTEDLESSMAESQSQSLDPKPHRSSWEYEADDSFKFDTLVSIPEAEPESTSAPDPHPIRVVNDLPTGPTSPSAPFVPHMNDVRSRLAHLSDLTLPPSPDDIPEPPGPPEDDQEASPLDSVVGELPLLTSRRKPPRPTFGRLKTRLQDPPPMTPAVSDQLASIWSEPGSRSRRNSLVHQPVGDDDGQQYARFGPVTGRRFSITIKDDPDQAQIPRLGPLPSRKSVSLSATDAPASTAAGAAPAAVTSRLAMFSPSNLGMFSPSRLGLLSKSKANLAQPHAAEEEVDPLDDDSIPKYKRSKKKPRRWLQLIQWIGLFVLIIILILAVKLHALHMVVWKEIALWQWLALGIVIVSGRLIASWCVMILVALIERHYILKKRVLYFVYGLRHAVKNCIWLALVIGVWKLVFRNIEEKNNVPIVTKVLWCLFTSSCLWMLKILAVKVAANSFHRAAYFDRVQDCLFHQYVLETLSAPRSDAFDFQSDSGRSQPPNSSPDVHQLPSAKPAGAQPSSLPVPISDPQRSPEQQPADRIEKRGPPGESNQTTTTTTTTSSAAHITNPNLPSTPSRSNLGIASPSRSNLMQRQAAGASASRTNLGVHHGAPHAQASSLVSPRLRRCSVQAYGEPVPMIARSSSPIEQEKLQELTSETVSAWTLKRLMKLIRKTNIATFSSMLDREAGEMIDSEAQAKSAAKQIFYNIARPGEKFLTLNDFLYFLPEDQATRAFGLFEVNDAGHITKKALMKWVVNIYKERRALALTLSDNRTVVAKLHRVLDVLLVGIAITICFLIMGVNTQKLLVAFSSVVLPSVFVFGNAARSTFESLIFLFVMHPFDVGDRICVDGQPMIVEEMNILNTIFLSGSNEKIYYPNSILATKAISNYYRSPDQWDSIEFQIHAGTPVELLGLLKERMTKYIEGLPQFWYPVFRIVCKDIEDSTRMKMALWVQHHLNYQESGERWQRRSNMILHMKTQLEDLGIGFHLPRQEITVTGVPLLDVPAARHAMPM